MPSRSCAIAIACMISVTSFRITLWSLRVRRIGSKKKALFTFPSVDFAKDRTTIERREQTIRNCLMPLLAVSLRSKIDGNGSMQPWRTATIIAACAVLGAQTLVREADIPSVIRYFVPVAAEKQFACTVFPAEPRLNYSFRFTAGYRVEFPVIQPAGTDRRIFVVSRVRPVLGKPSYFMDTLNADADSKEGDVSLDGGEFELGTGVYHIDWAMFDSSAGVCRREWNIVATLEPPNLGLEL